jgi:haloalkane dehalogenase
MMNATTLLRTPDTCFAALPGFPYGPQYLDDLTGYEGTRIHYIDEGARDAGTTVLCLHGNPSWSYLYRKMIPVFTRAGLRVVAPDLIGFGRSDKPALESTHSFEFHRRMLLAFVERLDLRNLMLVCQDWGGVLGLTLPMAAPQRYTRLLVMNTGLAVGSGLSEGFKQWRRANAAQPDLDVSALFKRAHPDLSDAEASAYAAPFPSIAYKAALRAFPGLIPDAPDAPGAEMSRRARAWWSGQWQGRSFMVAGAQDPVIPLEAMRALAATIRGCPMPLVLPDVGHFVQERGAEVAELTIAALFP